eukprot:m.1664223 g.1664223  ORF g.1664223 m.1664223 type:complete len:61 (-) comp138607_c0_seq1:39-221(-)
MFSMHRNCLPRAAIIQVTAPSFRGEANMLLHVTPATLDYSLQPTGMVFFNHCPVAHGVAR